MRLLIVALGIALSAGCASPLYDWGSYENSLWKMYGDGYSPGDDLRALTAEVERTVEQGRKVPPGKFAHLGYLHFLQGDAESARVCFLQERELYPESACFIELMLGRMP